MSVYDGTDTRTPVALPIARVPTTQQAMTQTPNYSSQGGYVPLGARGPNPIRQGDPRPVPPQVAALQQMPQFQRQPVGRPASVVGSMPAQPNVQMNAPMQQPVQQMAPQQAALQQYLQQRQLQQPQPVQQQPNIPPQVAALQNGMGVSGNPVRYGPPQSTMPVNPNTYTS